MRKTEVGGQAVSDGVMMRGKFGVATAIRQPNGRISVRFKRTKFTEKKRKILYIPIIRGIVILFNSLTSGMKELDTSSKNLEENEPSKFELWLNKKLGKKTNDIFWGLAIFISLLISIGIFIVGPVLITDFIGFFEVPKFILNFIEALVSISIILIYMYLIGKTKEIKKLFEYHGAEHKTIRCYESEEELTIDNVKKSSRFHPRCGTNFLFIAIMVNVFLLSFISWNSLIMPIVVRLICLPLVVGVSYEIVKWIGKSNSILAKIISYPGLKLQVLTTREPNNEQIEVAIMALKKAEGIKEHEKTIEELLNISKEVLKKEEIDTYILDSNLLLGEILKQDKLYLLMNKNEKVPKYKEKKFMELLEKRKRRMPMQYILKKCEFMGLDFYVEEGVLVPRGDTEILVEEVLKNIDKNNTLKVCDLCCGSGAIGISLAHYRNEILVDLIDVESIPERVTKTNIKNLEVEERCTFIKSDLLNEAINNEKVYDIIVSNPPYIREEVIETLMDDVKNYEPHIALNGGVDGLDFYRKIINDSKCVLRKNGILAFEIGFDQGEDVKLLMQNGGYKDIRVINDLSGLNRVVIGRL